MRRLQRCEIHPDNPQSRLLQAAADRLRAGAVVALPTAVGYLAACRLDDKTATTRLLRQTDERQPALLLCRDLAQAASYLQIDDQAFRAIREAEAGVAAFLLRCTHRVPRRLASAAGGAGLLYFGVHPVCQGLLERIDVPLLAAPPGQGIEEVDQLPPEALAVLDITLDAGPLSEMRRLSCMALCRPSRPALARWAGTATDAGELRLVA